MLFLVEIRKYANISFIQRNCGKHEAEMNALASKQEWVGKLGTY